ncbi:MAG: MBL fold metallo-hydrolase [Acidobacteria bacterium]|nr:MBL fold metallo-hydrolase [Acidobacteriota bacterium]
MSEILDGLVPAQPSTPIESAVVVAIRPAGHGWDVLLGLRSRRARFFPAHWACPGGRLEDADRPAEPGAYARCAARELAEETGVEVRPEDLKDIGVRVTPPSHCLRYRSPFFLALLPPDATVPEHSPSPDENEELRFFPAADVLAAWERGEIGVPPPLPPILRVLAALPRAGRDELLRALRADAERDLRAPRIEFTSGIWFHAVRSATLPPASHTNVWMPGGERFAIVDPGCEEPAEIAQLLAICERRLHDGSRPHSVVLTHHHRDHAGGAAAIARELGLPVLAHPATLTLYDPGPGIAAEPALVEDARLDLGGMVLRVHHLPGHAPGHVVLAVEGRGCAIIGDLLSGVSTVLIDPATGDMGAYMESLRRARTLGLGLLLPAHGPPLAASALDKALAHREDRERQVREALRDEPRPLADIAREAYADTPGVPSRLAELQALAHLLHLQQQGAATCSPAATWRKFS